MKRLSRILPVLILIVMVLSIGGAYATWQYAGQTSTEHSFDLTMELSKEVHITDAVFSENKSGGEITVNGFIKTYFNSKVNLEHSGSTVTVKITVYNNSLETQAFNAVKYHTEQYDNADIIVTPSIQHGDAVASGEYLEFNVTFSYKKGITPSNTTLNSYLLFEFMPLDKLPPKEEIAVDGALEQFKNIINNIVSEGSFQALIDQMDDFDNNDRHDESYIGNVGGASDEDTALLEELFQGNLTINIDGVDTDVTIIIKRENVDGDNNTGDADGNEMTIYMTTDDLKRDSWWSAGDAPVYVSVFTSDDDGELWYQLGDMYEGTATIKAYDGNPFGEGSFDTDTWRSTNNKTIGTIIKAL